MGFTLESWEIKNTKVWYNGDYVIRFEVYTKGIDQPHDVVVENISNNKVVLPEDLLQMDSNLALQTIAEKEAEKHL